MLSSLSCLLFSTHASGLTGILFNGIITPPHPHPVIGLSTDIMSALPENNENASPPLPPPNHTSTLWAQCCFISRHTLFLAPSPWWQICFSLLFIYLMFFSNMVKTCSGLLLVKCSGQPLWSVYIVTTAEVDLCVDHMYFLKCVNYMEK